MGLETDKYLISWSKELSVRQRSEAFVTNHRMHETELCSDANLEALIDAYPRKRLQVFSMGEDPFDNSQWEPVDTSGASGRDILTAVAKGRLWVKLRLINEEDRAWKDLVTAAYDDMRTLDPSFKPLFLRPLLLISSPGALVYYHSDINPTMLWQLRGAKRVWIYPPDEEFIAAELLEQIHAGEVDEEAPHQSEFESACAVFDLHPGEVLSWPLHAPHRVVNHDSVNISLSVPFGTRESLQTGELYHSNLVLRRRFGITNPSTRQRGALFHCKRLSFKVARRLGLTQTAMRTRQPYRATLRVDGAADNGVIEIPEVQTPF